LIDARPAGTRRENGYYSSIPRSAAQILRATDAPAFDFTHRPDAQTERAGILP